MREGLEGREGGEPGVSPGTTPSTSRLTFLGSPGSYTPTQGSSVLSSHPAGPTAGSLPAPPVSSKTGVQSPASSVGRPWTPTARPAVLPPGSRGWGLCPGIELDSCSTRSHHSKGAARIPTPGSVGRAAQSGHGFQGMVSLWTGSWLCCPLRTSRPGADVLLGPRRGEEGLKVLRGFLPAQPSLPVSGLCPMGLPCCWATTLKGGQGGPHCGARQLS